MAVAKIGGQTRSGIIGDRGDIGAGSVPLFSRQSPVFEEVLETCFDDGIAAAGWGDWQALPGIKLERAGVLRWVSKRRYSGAVKRGVAVEPGGYYRLELCGENLDGVEISWSVRDSEFAGALDHYHGNQARLVPMAGRMSAEEPCRVDFRVFGGAERLDFYLLVQHAQRGQRFQVERVTLMRIDAAAACPRPDRSMRWSPTA